MRVPISECEYDPILVVDADRMKSLEVSAQLFQSVVRWNPKVSERGGAIEQIELALNELPNRFRNPTSIFRVLPVIEVLSDLVSEPSNHVEHPILITALMQCVNSLVLHQGCFLEPHRAWAARTARGRVECHRPACAR